MVMMNKDEAIDFLIQKIDSTQNDLVISKSECKYIDQQYKKLQNDCNSLSDFIDKDPKLKALLKKVPALAGEIDKQLEKRSALQRGIAFECVLTQTLAKACGLKKFYDLEKTPFSELPKMPIEYVKSSVDTACSARYMYCCDNDNDLILFQYGNPKDGDATAIVYCNEIVIEIKDLPALMCDKDLIYDEYGHIIIDESLKEDYPAYIECINEFNKETNIFAQLGHNYVLDVSQKLQEKLINQYFNSGNIDVLLIAANDELIVLKAEDINHIFVDGSTIISTEGSEIRTAGKNTLKPFTPKYLKKTLKQRKAIINGNDVFIPANSDILGKTVGRGHQNKVTRLKISNAFYVHMDNVTQDEKGYHFEYDKIRQVKSGISLHISLMKSRQEIYDALYRS